MNQWVMREIGPPAVSSPTTPRRWRVIFLVVDVCIAEKDLERRKVGLSIKLLEEIEKKEALEKYGAEEGSGKQLPFSSLSEDLKKKEDEKK